MAVARKRSGAYLFLGVMYRDKEQLQKALQLFSSQQGVTLRDSFTHLEVSSFSSYYDTEMGEGIFKDYYLFEGEFDVERLALVKVATNELEQQFLSASGGRQINLDPGYITRDKLVLASAKDFYHRIAIGHNIFAEVTLHFTEKGPRFFSWTYEDYLQEGVQALLMRGRKALLKRG